MFLTGDLQKLTRDALKTAIGLVLIVGIVGATFWYGNAQRQTQLRKAANTQATPTPTVSSAPVVAGSNNGDTNTAPVKSPSSNVIQGGGVSITPTPTQKSTPTSVPTTGGSNDTLPDTGAPISGVIGGVAILASAIWYRRSVVQLRRQHLR